MKMMLLLLEVFVVAMNGLGPVVKVSMMLHF
jgi:hypothetical protein